MVRKSLIILLIFLSGHSFISAQETRDDLSKQAANPIADLMSFPFQNNLNIDYGEFNRNMNVLNIQPVLPFAKGRIVTRTILPILWIPDFYHESGMLSSGIGDIVFTAFYVPANQPFIWGVGPVVEFPTGGEYRGSQKWSLGPSGVMLVQPGNWTFGLLLNNVWSVAGKSERNDVNRMLLNLFIVYQLRHGWYVNSAPIITSNWNAEPSDQWIVPIGAGGGKLLMLGGKLPLNLQTQMYYNIVNPEIGPKWQWRFQVQILLPKSILNKKS